MCVKQVIVCGNTGIYHTVRTCLDRQAVAIAPARLYTVADLCRQNKAKLLVAHVTERGPMVLELFELKATFSDLPVLIITEDLDYDLARLCGEKGIDKVVHINDIQKVRHFYEELAPQKLSVRLSDLGYKVCHNQYSPVINEALQVVETDYQTLKGTSELSNRLHMSDGALIREFKKHQLPSPKQLLMYFKIFHAVRMMKTSALSVKEVAYNAGFSNEKRFIECFSRTVGVTPGNFRLQRQLLLKKASA